MHSTPPSPPAPVDIPDHTSWRHLSLLVFLSISVQTRRKNGPDVCNPPGSPRCVYYTFLWVCWSFQMVQDLIMSQKVFILNSSHCLLSTDAGSPEGTHSAAVLQSTGSQRDTSGEQRRRLLISAPLSSVSWPPCCCRSSEDDLHEGVRSFNLLPKAQQKRPQVPGWD